MTVTQNVRFSSVRRCLITASSSLLALAMFVGQSAQAQTYTVLHRFKGGRDGVFPQVVAIRDSKGRLYGTTCQGGSFAMGTVFEIDTQGKETILHDFWGGDGYCPDGRLIRDEAGNFYGVTYKGGNPEGGGCFHGCGAVFKLDTKGNEKVLYAFTGGTDGRGPQGGLVHDQEGNFYGSTLMGGDLSCKSYQPGCGAVFKLDKNGKESVLHAFTGGSDGSAPRGRVILDRSGNLYGVTSEGGAFGWGVVFRLDPAGQETILYSFTGGADGAVPSGTLVFDSIGNLYGETLYGGNLSACNLGYAKGCGVLFKLDPAGKETVLYAFTGKTDQSYPAGGLVLDGTGRLYGVTQGSYPTCSSLCGTIFKLDPSGNETVLYTFSDGKDGYAPNGVIMDKSGDLYGTTYGGGDLSCLGPWGCGVVFRLDP